MFCFCGGYVAEGIIVMCCRFILFCFFRCWVYICKILFGLDCEIFERKKLIIEFNKVIVYFFFVLVDCYMFVKVVRRLNFGLVKIYLISIEFRGYIFMIGLKVNSKINGF